MRIEGRDGAPTCGPSKAIGQQAIAAPRLHQSIALIEPLSWTCAVRFH